MVEDFKNLLSKTKDIYIPLKNYAYFHSPSSIDKKDNRMVGRKELITKIRSLLNNSKTKSGAYLVTGYRGVGKTSLVNNALRGIVDLPPILKPLYHHLLTVFILLTLYIVEPTYISLFEKQIPTNLWIWVIAGIAGASLLLYKRSDIGRLLCRPHKAQDELAATISIKTSLAALTFIIWKHELLDPSPIGGKVYPLIVLLIFLLVSLELLRWSILGLNAAKLKLKIFWKDLSEKNISLEMPTRLFARLHHFYQAISKYFYNRFNFSNRVTIKLNLGHESLSEEDILRLIAKRVHSKYKRFGTVYWQFPFNFTVFKLFIIVILTELIYCEIFLPASRFSIEQFYSSAPFIFRFLYEIFSHFILYIQLSYSQLASVLNSNDFAPLIILPETLNFLQIGIFLFLWWGAIRISRINFYYFSTHERVQKRLNTLMERISAQITKEGGSKLGNKLSFISIFESKSSSYPLADAREIESELISIFEEMDRIPIILGRPSFVFVLDELDKIQSLEYSQSQNSDDNNQFLSSHEIIRKRNHIVASLLANLKHFLTTVRAKFILIAGREMYDASLADISNRNYFLGSIFHEIIYVNSLLTEKPDDPDPYFQARPGHMSYFHSSIELFVCQTLIPKGYRPNESRSLKTLTKKLEEDYGIQRFKDVNESQEPLSDRHLDVIQVLFGLRNFISYLSYRSSGMPMKLVSLFEQYVKKIDTTTDISTRSIARNKRPSKRIFKIPRFLTRQNTLSYEYICISEDLPKGLYLKFSQNDLYTFGLISYLTVPFYYNVSRHIRNFGDKLMVSSSYLLDHFYKFHNYGFSWRNLELTPEIVDINKAPVLRKIIGDIVDFLAYTNLEKISSGLYDYKFNSRIAQEIDYLSKISEKESAAFNFTLDESQEIKKHYKQKLKSVLEENPVVQMSFKHKEDPHAPIFLHSVTMIQQSLGDLYYYDQEYDDAIISYQNAIFMFRGVTNQEMARIPEDILLIFIRIALKLGNAFERKKSTQSALMTYSSLSQSILRNLEIVIDLESESTKDSSVTNEEVQSNNNEEIKIDAPYLKNMVRKMTIESMRHVYQPFIAKLIALEKVKNGGVNSEDINTVEKEIESLIDFCDTEIQPTMRMEYLNKLGDLVHFRNLRLPSSKITLDNLSESYYQRAIERYQNLSIQDFKEKSFYVHKGFDELKSLANCISDLADSKFSNLYLMDKGSSRTARFRYKYVFDKNITPVSEIDKKVREILHDYLKAYNIHINNDDHKRAAFQQLKILHLIVARCDFNEEFDPVGIRNNVVNTALVSYYRAYSSSTRPEIERAKGFLKIPVDLDPRLTPYIFRQLPPAGEIQEILSLFQFVLIQQGNMSGVSFKDISPGYCPVYSNMYSRLVQLSVKVRFNNKRFKKNIVNEKEYLIADSIYCLTEMIRVIQNFGVNYSANNSFLGFAYEQRYKWLENYSEFYNMNSDQKGRQPRIYNLLRKLIGAESMDKLNIKYNIEKAITYYTKSKELHDGKFVYDTEAMNTYYMDDSFNDEYMHFYISLERSKLSRINKKIQNLEEKLKNESKLYRTENYFEHYN